MTRLVLVIVAVLLAAALLVGCAVAQGTPAAADQAARCQAEGGCFTRKALERALQEAYQAGRAAERISCGKLT